MSLLSPQTAYSTTISNLFIVLKRNFALYEMPAFSLVFLVATELVIYILPIY